MSREYEPLYPASLWTCQMLSKSAITTAFSNLLLLLLQAQLNVDKDNKNKQAIIKNDGNKIIPTSKILLSCPGIVLSMGKSIRLQGRKGKTGSCCFWTTLLYKTAAEIRLACKCNCWHPLVFLLHLLEYRTHQLLPPMYAISRFFSLYPTSYTLENVILLLQPVNYVWVPKPLTT